MEPAAEGGAGASGVAAGGGSGGEGLHDAGSGTGGESGDPECDVSAPPDAGEGGQGGEAGASALPAIDYVSPYVGYLGEQQPVIIRGRRLPDRTTVCFGKRKATRVEVVSDSEIRATPPALARAGRATVTLGVDTPLSYSTAELVVRPHPRYEPFAVVTGVGIQDRHLIYDAERDAVFSYCRWFNHNNEQAASTIQRYAYDAATRGWRKTASYIPNLLDIALSPDGKYLLALAPSRLWWLDAVTMATLDFVDFTAPNAGTASQLGVVNDGKVLIRDLGLAYSLVTKTFSPARSPSGIGIVVSADGSRAIVGGASSTDALSIYDASTGIISPSAPEYFQVPSMDRTGDRYFSGGNLRDRELSLIGAVPTSLAFMSVDGLRAYEVDPNDNTHIRVFDLTGDGPTFAQLDDIIVPNTIDSDWIQGSLDSRFLFIAGASKFIVVPVP